MTITVKANDNDNASDAKTVTIQSAGTTRTTIKTDKKKLTKGTVKVRIRCCKGKIYSLWSETKSAAVK